MNQGIWLALMFEVVSDIQPGMDEDEGSEGEAERGVVRKAVQRKEGTGNHPAKDKGAEYDKSPPVWCHDLFLSVLREVVVR